MSRGIATPARPRPPKAGRARLALWEDRAYATSPLVVDREKGIIRGVKVCGTESRNGRRYPLTTLREAVQLYAGKPCNFNHPDKQNGNRQVTDRIGQFANPELRQDGVYADLEYNRAHPWAEWLAEQAERFPGTLGFSHNAEGDTEFVAGKPTVTRILEVRSVDLVADPATTNGLFEGERPVTTLRKLLEGRTWTDKRKLWATWLLEDDAMPGMTADLPAEPGDADPDAQLWTGFSSAINAILDQYKAGELDAAAASKAIGKYVKAHARLTSKDEPGTDSPDTEEMEEAVDRFERCVKEVKRKGGANPWAVCHASTKEELDRLKGENATLTEKVTTLTEKTNLADLCRKENFAPDGLQEETLLAVRGDDKRKKLIESWRRPAGDRPRSGPPRTADPPPDGEAPKTAEEAARRWKR